MLLRGRKKLEEMAIDEILMQKQLQNNIYVDCGLKNRKFTLQFVNFALWDKLSESGKNFKNHFWLKIWLDWPAISICMQFRSLNFVPKRYKKISINTFQFIIFKSITFLLRFLTKVISCFLLKTTRKKIQYIVIWNRKTISSLIFPTKKLLHS